MTDAEQQKAREEAARAANRGEAAWRSYEEWAWFGEGTEPVGLMSPSAAARAAWTAARQGMVSAVPSSPVTIGPRPLPTKLSCAGCPALKAEDWREEYPRDRGTRADCIAAERTIGMYWSADTKPPTWCPALAAQHAIPEPKESR
jgi:hypothetical protein